MKRGWNVWLMKIEKGGVGEPCGYCLDIDYPSPIGRIACVRCDECDGESGWDG